MADHNIEINVNLNGSERAKQELQNLNDTIDSLNRKEVSPRVAMAQIAQQAQSVRREIESLTRQRNNIRLELEMKGNVRETIAKLESQFQALGKEYASSLGGGKPAIPLARIVSQMEEVNSQITFYKNLLDSLGSTPTDLEMSTDQLKLAEQLLKEMQNQMREIGNDESLKNALNMQTTGLDEAIRKLETLASIANEVGSAFQGVNNFIGGIGSSFSQMSNLFGTDIWGYAKQTLTQMATQSLMGNIGDMISRYDILTTFSDYMEIAGVDRATADESLQRINKSILGLPIGLDESAYRLRRYQMFLGDTEQATNFTIGLQNALTAGGASESMKNMAYMQMERLLATGDLATFRQWQSLITGFGVSSRFIADAISEIEGKQITPKQLTEGLNDGTIAVEEFMKAVEMLGQDWSNTPVSEIPQFVTDMNSALDVYRGTIEAWQKNIQFAVTRGGANVIAALNDTMKEAEDTGITGVLENVRNLVNDIFAGGSEFIRSNPQYITEAFRMVGDLVDRAKGLQWGNFADSVFGNIGTLFETVAVAFDAIPPGALESFASFAITIAGPAGALIQTMQGGFPQMLAVFKAFHDFDFPGFVQNVTGQLSGFTNIVGGVLRLFNNDFFSNVGAFALVWGPAIVKVMSGISGAFTYIGNSLNALRTGEGATLLSWLLTFGAEHASTLGLMGMAGAGGAIGYGVTYAMTARMRAQAKREAEAIDAARSGASLINVDTMKAEVEELAKQPGVLAESWKSSLSEIDVKARESRILVSETLKLDEQVKKASSEEERKRTTEQLTANIERLKGLVPDLTLSIDTSTGALNAESAAALADAEAFIILADAKAKAEGASSVIAEAEANRIRLKTQRSELYPLYAAAVSETERNREVLERLLANPEYAEATGRQLFDTDIDSGVGLTPQFTEEYTKRVAEAAAAYDESKNQVKSLGEDIGVLNNGIAENDELMKNAQSVLGETSDAVNGLAESYNGLTEAEQAAIDRYNEFKDTATQNILEMFGGYGRVEDVPEHTDRIGEIIENNKYNTTRANYRAERTETVNEWLEELSETNPEVYDQIDDAVAGIYETVANDPGEVGLIFSLADLAESGNLDKLIEFAETIDQKSEGAQRFADALSQGFASITGVQLEEEEPDVIPGWKKFIESFNEFVTNGIPKFAEAAKEHQSDIQDFSGEIETTSKHAETAKKNLDEAKISAGNLGTTASLKQGLVDNFAGSVSGVGSAARQAASTVAALAAAMSALQSKTIHLNIQTSGFAVNPAGGVGVVNPAVWPYATGGEVFGPGGIDNVPAMLTAGEFVIKRDAAKKFGPTFLEKVNGMDIGGAFDALMHNLARPAGLGFMPNVTYNRDNHAQVTINNNGETGQGYSQRKAYAWASKL